MKKIIVIPITILVSVILLSSCQKKDNANTPAKSSTFSEESEILAETSEFIPVPGSKKFTENVDKNAALIEAAQTETRTASLWYMEEGTARGKVEEFTAENEVELSGKYEDVMPPINNTVDLFKDILKVEGRCVSYPLTAAQYFSTECGNTAFSPSPYSEPEYPTAVLRQMDNGILYDVKKYNKGGYIYSFHDKEFNLETGEYTSDDPTNIYLIGGVYVENILSYKNFKDLKVGDSIETVCEIDSATNFYEVFFATRSENLFGEYARKKTTSLHLLTDGLLAIHYELTDGEYIVTDMVFSEEFIYDSPYIREKYGISYPKCFRILEQDYPPVD